MQQALRGPRGGSDMTPEDARFFTVVAMKRPSEWTDEEKQRMNHLRAKYKMDVDPEFSGYTSSGSPGVDPFAPTEEIPDDEVPTVRTPRLYKENKKISKSDLQQMIMQELKAASKKD